MPKHLPAAGGQERRSRQLRCPMRQKQHHATRSIPAPGRGLFGSDGTALAEFALAAPILVTLVLGIADFGMLAAKNAALEGATRVGAEYARNNPTCSQGDLTGNNCTTGSKTAEL